MKKGFGEFIIDNAVWIILAIAIVVLMIAIMITRSGANIEFPWW